jgi:hypothetical protein
MSVKLAAGVILLALFIGNTPALFAAEKVRCEVLTIQASNSGDGVAKALESYATIFKQKPFSGFNTFQLVRRTTYSMPLGMHQKLVLPKPLSGSLLLRGETSGKLDLTLSLTPAGKKPITINGNALPGAPFFAAGLKNDTGIWVLGVICNRSNLNNH